VNDKVCHNFCSSLFVVFMTSVTELWFLQYAVVIIISPQSHVRRMLPVWLYQTPQDSLLCSDDKWLLLDF
jgi:hypothetical protein